MLKGSQVHVSCGFLPSIMFQLDKSIDLQLSKVLAMLLKDIYEHMDFANQSETCS